MDEQTQATLRAARGGDATALDVVRATMGPGLRVANLRLGFATNSSSSHSVVFAPGVVEDVLNRALDHDLGFGWGSFVLASREQKSRYFAAAMIGTWKARGLGKLETCMLARGMFDAGRLDGFTNDELWGAYIDHQSMPSIPHPRVEEDGYEPLIRMIKEEIIDREGVLILGGNDNDDASRPVIPGAVPVPFYDKFPVDAGYGNDGKPAAVVHRVDPVSGHLTTFDRKTGRKVRIVRGESPDVAFSSVPETVDLKITDWCNGPTGGPDGSRQAGPCDYCYQGSTTKGKHAKKEALSSLAYALGSAGVLECAIGGGEPTSHPHFADFLRELVRAGVTPSFSTQSWKWLEDEELSKVVAETCGGVALSTQDPAHVVPWIQRCALRGIKPYLHYVLGLSPIENLRAFLSAFSKDAFESVQEVVPGYGFRAHVVLLAHKAVGRASGGAPHPWADWGRVLQETLSTADGEEHELLRHRWNVAVDSFLVESVPTQLTGVDQRLYEQADGRFTCYFDAVEEEWAAHSFVLRGEFRWKGGVYDMAPAWSAISGAPWLDADGRFHTTGDGERVAAWRARWFASQHKSKPLPTVGATRG